MTNKKHILIKDYFAKYNFVQSNIDSFDDFIDWRLQKLIDELGEATPAVIPPETEEVKFRFGKIRVERPILVEADGSLRHVIPSEARLRDLTYSAPVFLEISLIIDNKERERAEVQIADLPIMLKSKLCNIHGLKPDELIKLGEDPYDTGGYFLINGTERILVLLEDLAANQIFVSKEKTGPITHTARLFSASDIYKIPHALERTKEGILTVSFGGVKKVPLTLLVKALGITKDAEVTKIIPIDGIDEEIYINLFDFIGIKTADEAKEAIAKTMGLTFSIEQKIQRVNYVIDNLLLPHIGATPESRKNKAYYLGRMAKKLFLLKRGVIKTDDKDHYMNKRVRLAGDLLEDLFRANLKVLVNDMLYIFQRGVRRGRILPIPSIVRTKLLSQRIKSAMATGNWTGNRQGVSQRLERDNALATLSHLQRVSSLLESTRESFEARGLHPTHWGRLCPLESPEGKNIGLRKNLSLLSEITPKLKQEDVEETVKVLKTMGLKTEVAP